jgi:hypothetical protein
VSFIAATVVVVGIVLQLYFITAWVFGESGALDAHRGVGNVIWFVELVVLISGAVAWWGNWRNVAWSVALAVFGTIQIFFVGDIDDQSGNSSGWVHGFHGGLALFVFILAAVIAHREMRALGLRGKPASPGGA